MNTYTIGTRYQIRIAELLAELARVNARRREILTVLGAEAEQS